MAREGRKRSQRKKSINLASKQLKQSKYRDEVTRSTLDKRVQDIYTISTDRDKSVLEHCLSSERAIQSLENDLQALRSGD